MASSNIYSTNISVPIVDKIYEYIGSIKNETIILLRNKTVIMWLFGDTSFLPPIESKNKKADTDKLKKLEDEWGRTILKYRRPDLKLEGQWTGKFCELIAQELIILSGKTPNIPIKKEHFKPDWETETHIIESKGETFFTTGTAGEKILGVPFKYRDIPTLYSKPLLIICMGGAEKSCREEYGTLSGSRCNETAQKLLNYYKSEFNISYIGASDVLSSLISL
jgi:hypothetical protein